MDEEIKILCVDDEPNVLRSLKRLFLDDKYTILTADSGSEGINILEKEQIQLVISDYRMPVMNGVEFLKEVYRRWPHTVRIVLSGYADMAAIIGAINEGQIYKFIPKPWNDDELKVTVANSIERYFLYKKNIELTSELQQKNAKLETLNNELKRLLEQEKANLEFKSKVLEAQQSILDMMPVGILGIDSSDMVVMSNSISQQITGRNMLGAFINDAMPEEIARFINRIRENKKSAYRINIDSMNALFLGSVIERPGEEGSVIIVIVKEEDIR